MRVLFRTFLAYQANISHFSQVDHSFFCNSDCSPSPQSNYSPICWFIPYKLWYFLPVSLSFIDDHFVSELEQHIVQEVSSCVYFYFPPRAVYSSSHWFDWAVYHERFFPRRFELSVWLFSYLTQLFQLFLLPKCHKAIHTWLNLGCVCLWWECGSGF